MLRQFILISLMLHRFDQFVRGWDTGRNCISGHKVVELGPHSPISVIARRIFVYFFENAIFLLMYVRAYTLRDYIGFNPRYRSSALILELLGWSILMGLLTIFREHSRFYLFTTTHQGFQVIYLLAIAHKSLLECTSTLSERLVRAQRIFGQNTPS